VLVPGTLRGISDMGYHIVTYLPTSSDCGRRPDLSKYDLYPFILSCLV
jgi:hypothetical protein